MKYHRFTAFLLLGFTACADHSGGQLQVQAPPPPIDEPLPPLLEPMDLGERPADPRPGNDPTGGGNPGSPVPEPLTLLLVGSGLAAAAVLHRRRETNRNLERPL